jgi:hypothetical protein
MLLFQTQISLWSALHFSVQTRQGAFNFTALYWAVPPVETPRAQVSKHFVTARVNVAVATPANCMIGWPLEIEINLIISIKVRATAPVV